MKYRKRPEVVDAVQWFKNGDHPKDHSPIGIANPSALDRENYAAFKEHHEGMIVRRYRAGSVAGAHPCSECERTMHEHGFIESAISRVVSKEEMNPLGQRVCPGDWIVTIDGLYLAMKPDAFAATYEPGPETGLSGE